MGATATHGGPVGQGVPTLEAIDAALAAWSTDLARLGENLDELDGDPTRQRLGGAAVWPALAPDPALALEGATAERVAPALAALDQLLADRQLLEELIGRARAARQRLGPLAWPGERERTLREIGHLLFGAAIPDAATATPLASRDLLAPAQTQEWRTARELLATMERAFGPARDAILACGAAWARADAAIDGAAAEAARLARRAAPLGDAAVARATAACAAVDALRARVARDPLGADAGLAGSVAPTLRALADELDALDALRCRVAADRAAAGLLLAALPAAAARAAAAVARAASAVADHEPFPVAPDAARVDALAAWLATLDETRRAGRLRAAAVGLRRWLTVATAARDAAAAAEAAATAAAALPDELSGRLAARRDQERAYRQAGAPLAAAATARAAALLLLAARPVPLRRAAAALAAYEAALRAAARR